MITNRTLFVGAPIGAVVIAVTVLAVLQWQSTTVVVDAGFWFDDVTFELSSLDSAELGGPITDVEKDMIRSMARSELERAYSGLRIRFTEDPEAFYKVRVAEGFLDRGAAGQARVMAPFGGVGAVSFMTAVRGAFAYAPPGATRRVILEGIGRGVGRIAVHEFAHQIISRVNIHDSRDDRSYEYSSPDRIGQYYGPIHWSIGWAPLQEQLGH